MLWSLLRNYTANRGALVFTRYPDVYGEQSAEKNCKGECHCEPQFALGCGTQSVEKSDSVTGALVKQLAV